MTLRSHIPGGEFFSCRKGRNRGRACELALQRDAASDRLSRPRQDRAGSAPFGIRDHTLLLDRSGLPATARTPPKVLLSWGPRPTGFL